MSWMPSPAFVQLTPTNPTAQTSATYVMAGLGAQSPGWTITPMVSGRVLAIIMGDMTGVNTATVTVQLSFGTGGAPANNAAVTGTQIGGQPTFLPVTGVLTGPFTLVAIITGLAVPTFTSAGLNGTTTPVWLDVAFKASSGAAQLTNLTCSAVEI